MLNQGQGYIGKFRFHYLKQRRIFKCGALFDLIWCRRHNDVMNQNKNQIAYK